jgi:hypothetical protein
VTGFDYYYFLDYCWSLFANTIKEAIIGLGENYYLLKVLDYQKGWDQ